MSSTEGVVLLVLICVACLGQSAAFGYDLWRRRDCWSTWRSVCPGLWGWLKQPDELVASEVNRRLCEAVRAAGSISGALWLVYSVAYAFVPDSESWLTERQHYVLTICNFSVLCIRLCPERALRRSLPLWFGWAMACTGAFVHFADVSNVFAPLRSMAIANVMRLALCFVFGQVGTSILCNALVAMANTYTVWIVPRESRDNLGGPFSIFAFEAIIMIAIIAFTWSQRTALERECAHEVENHQMGVESSAMTALLDSVCDVVVELDESLQVREHAPRLSAMLAVNRSTQGMALSQYILHDSDRERFEHKMRGSDDSGPGACEQGEMHVTLRDSMNNAVPVEIFYVAFQSVGSKRSCFAGIREIGDHPIAELTDQTSKLPGLGNDEGVALEGHGTSPSAERHRLGDDQTRVAPGTSFRTSQDDEASSVSSAHSKSFAGWTLLDDRFMVTSLYAKKLALCEMMARCNIRIPARSCCALHAELNELRALVREVSKCVCYKSFDLIGTAQCAGCGLILHSQDFGGNREHCEGHPVTHVARPRARDAPGPGIPPPPASIAL